VKGTYTKENGVWCIKIYSNNFDKKSVARMHKLLDDGISEVSEVIKLEKRISKLLKEK
jgi:hypothetical protein